MKAKRAPKNGKPPMSSGAKRTRVAATDIFRGVIRLIHKRVYHPGERIREQELADRFGVSRGPVREALRMLEAKGVVRIEPMRGASVARMSDSEIVESVDIAAALFALAAEQAAARATPEERTAIRKGIAKLAELAHSDIAPRDFFVETIRAGQLVVESAHSPQLQAMIADVRAGWPNILGALGFTSRRLRRRAADKWQRLGDALDAGRSSVAARLAVEVHQDAMRQALKIGF
jgi:DNA-binding GntR family transcriptional regulator